MDLFTLLRTCVRRWVVVVPVLILTGAVAWWVSASSVPTYKANASVLVVGPSINGSNPFGELNSAITSTAIAIQRTVSGPATRAELDDLGLYADFEVTASGGGDEPILDVKAEGDSPDQALGTVSGVIDAIDTELTSRQEELKVAPQNLITVQVLASDESASKEQGPVMRSMVLVIALGLALAAAVAVTVDRVLPKDDRSGRGRRRRKKGEPGDGSEDGGGGDAQPPRTRAARRSAKSTAARSVDTEAAPHDSTSTQSGKPEGEVRWPA